MRILVLGEGGPDLAAIENALRLGKVELIRAAEPRTELADGRRFAFAGYVLDAATRDLISSSGRRVELTSSEFDLLMAFLARPGQPQSRSALMSALRGRDWTYFDRSIDTLVARLRRKIDIEVDRPLIRSVRGVGYVLCANVSLTPPADQPTGA